MINSATITSKGQVTIPLAIRNKLKLKTGDQVMFLEDNGSLRLCPANSFERAVKRANKALAGAAQEAGFTTEEDLQKYLLEIRREARGH